MTQTENLHRNNDNLSDRRRRQPLLHQHRAGLDSQTHSSTINFTYGGAKLGARYYDATTGTGEVVAIGVGAAVGVAGVSGS